MPDHYPFCRIVGQELLKTALLLVSVDPRIGGLLISGVRGSAKSTIVRGLSDLQQDKPFITLPLGATEEMITGSIDLESALNAAEVKFLPGLLSRADKGILYVDEVNLLFDHLVDLLLDAAASGVNIVERDNISHQHDASFVLIGTMNPDEGELRPQLLDRFGLMVEMETEFSIEERKQIVKRRLAFDQNPQAFIAGSQHESDRIRQQIQWATANLQEVTLSGWVETEIAKRCMKAGVEGMRADIIFYRAAVAWCALQQRLEVTTEDLDMVEPMVLNHRRNVQPGDSGSSGGNDSGGSGHSGQGGGPGRDGENGEGQAGNSQAGSSIQGSWGAMPPMPSQSLPTLPLPLPTHAKPQGNPAPPARHPAGGRSSNRNRGGLVGGVRYGAENPVGNKRIDWINTLGTAGFRALCYSDKRRALRFKYQLPETIRLDLIMLDTSTSTLGGRGLDHARGAIQAFSRRSYLNRRYLSIVTFGNDTVRTLLWPRRAPKNIEPVLGRIEAGGGTPIAKALSFVDMMLARQKYGHLNCHIYLLTDGRFDDAMRGHWAIHAFPVTVVDIECGRVPLGRGPRLAGQIDARYLHISRLLPGGDASGFAATGET